MKPLGFDHCVIAISDWAVADAFYRDVLGAEIPPHDHWWGEYRFGKWKLNVHGPGFEGLNARHPVEPGNSDLCFIWPGTIAQAVDHLAAHGVPVEAGPLEGDTGARGTGMHLYFRDPDGSLLEFVSYSEREDSLSGIFEPKVMAACGGVRVRLDIGAALAQPTSLSPGRAELPESRRVR